MTSCRVLILAGLAVLLFSVACQLIVVGELRAALRDRRRLLGILQHDRDLWAKWEAWRLGGNRE